MRPGPGLPGSTTGSASPGSIATSRASRRARTSSLGPSSATQPWPCRRACPTRPSSAAVAARVRHSVEWPRAHRHDQRAVRRRPRRGGVSVDEIEAFLDEINRALPSARLTLADVRHAFAGLYPLTEDVIRPGVYQGTGVYQLVDHARSARLDGFITVLGAKYTTARVGRASRRPRGAEDRGAGEAVRTATTPLAGGATDDVTRSCGRSRHSHRARRRGDWRGISSGTTAPRPLLVALGRSRRAGLDRCRRSARSRGRGGPRRQARGGPAPRRRGVQANGARHDGPPRMPGARARGRADGRDPRVGRCAARGRSRPSTARFPSGSGPRRTAALSIQRRGLDARFSPGGGATPRTTTVRLQPVPPARRLEARTLPAPQPARVGRPGLDLTRAKPAVERQSHRQALDARAGRTRRV
jgi:hypothetical protein